MTVDYLAHFNLALPPFAPTADPSFYFPVHDHSNIVASLEFAIRRDFGIVKLVGETGTGKTLLSRMVTAGLSNGQAAVAYLDARAAGRMMAALCDGFSLSVKGDPYDCLRAFLIKQNHTGSLAVAVIDEAQHLELEDFLALLRLETLEIDKKKLLQIILLGDTSLDERLTQPGLQTLNSHIVFSLSTRPLAEAEARRYLLHRLHLAHRPEVMEQPIFSEAALDQLARSSGGLPNLLNLLADRALQAAVAEGAKMVQVSHAAQAIKAFPGLVVKKPTWLDKRGLTIGLSLALVLALAWLGWVWSHRLPPLEPVAAPIKAEVPPPVPAKIEPPPVKTEPAPLPPVVPVKPEAPPAPPAKIDPAPAPAPAPAPVKVEQPPAPPVKIEPPPAAAKIEPAPQSEPSAPPPAKSKVKAKPTPKPKAKAVEVAPAAPPKPAVPTVISPDDDAPPPPMPAPQKPVENDEVKAQNAGSGVYPGTKR